MDWKPEPARSQDPLETTPYDRWVSPEGYCQAEFHARDCGYFLRFPGQADFLIELVGQAGGEVDQSRAQHRVIGWPTPECGAAQIINLFHNAIQPLLGNHSGGLFLHGSAVLIENEGGATGQENAGAVAFLGLSRGGKTTLAGSFAREGRPFLTEDVIDLRLEAGEYWLQPKRSKLRLFADSARFLLGKDTDIQDDNLKQDVEAGTTFPFADKPAPIRQIYVLGTDHRASLSIKKLSLQEALGALMPHSFILDVEDKSRLRGHFSRLADLSQDIGCYALDFTRDYAELPRVQNAVLETFRSDIDQRSANLGL
ncbi:hypothetical protein [Erythrobacter sp. Alg231-14]|uniref:hypothetical protein n=1 Tax=Erythrobacter sp. Alg231-14 TaxID=1922225 RepID=UPI000D5529B0